MFIRKRYCQGAVFHKFQISRACLDFWSLLQLKNKLFIVNLNAIKSHSEYFALLVKNTKDDPLDPDGLPDLPFLAVHDFVQFDKELGFEW